MAPNIDKEDGTMPDNHTRAPVVAPQASPRKYEIVYLNVLVFAYWHLAGLYGLYLCFTSAKWATVLFSGILQIAASLGVTAGVHRLWAHRSYKAKLPLQILLMLLHSLAYENTILHWARDHRLHHKFTDTDADPQNSTRGFFYSHFGWLLVRKLPEVSRKGKTIDMSDLEANPVLQFQKKYYYILGGLLAFALPTLIPAYFWQETLNNAYHIALFRFIAVYNASFLVNSAAHKYGNKPYEKNILATQNTAVSVLALGEGYHNYHHVFPYDYRAAELGNNYLNLTTLFIDFFAWIGWAYDLKFATDDMIVSRAKRTGDGTDLWGRKMTNVEGENPSKNIWGWGDKDMTREDKKGIGMSRLNRASFFFDSDFSFVEGFRTIS